MPSSPKGAVTEQAKPERIENPTGIDGVLAWKTAGSGPGVLQHDHVDGPVDYTVTPPVGGPHNAIWMNAGIYTAPIPPERAVHNLEHGAVWITYDPDLPASQVSALQAFVLRQTMIPDASQDGGTNGNANRYIDLSPWTTSDLPAPIVISAWGFQLRVTTPADPRLQRFVDTFRNSATYSPEYGAPVDGVPVLTGGRPVAGGSRQPNPPGIAGQ